VGGSRLRGYGAGSESTERSPRFLIEVADRKADRILFSCRCSGAIVGPLAFYTSRPLPRAKPAMERACDDKEAQRRWSFL